MRQRLFATFAVAAIAIAAPQAPILAQSISGQDLTPEGRGAYLSLAGALDAYTIRSSELALENARRPEVRALAQKLITEHRQASERLKETAGDSGRAFLDPPAMLPFQWEWLRDLEDASSRRFDREYLEQQVEAHEVAVEMHRNFAANGSDAQLKAYAEAVVPTASGHLQEVRQLEQ